jgi:hypothetical protein
MVNEVGLSLGYTYIPSQDNGNERTLQGFSTAAEDKMYRCEYCPYDTYEKFFQYYGVFDYADAWVDAAFSGTSTTFSNGNADFTQYDFPGKTGKFAVLLDAIRCLVHCLTAVVMQRLFRRVPCS